MAIAGVVALRSHGGGSFTTADVIGVPAAPACVRCFERACRRTKGLLLCVCRDPFSLTLWRRVVVPMWIEMAPVEVSSR